MARTCYLYLTWIYCAAIFQLGRCEYTRSDGRFSPLPLYVYPTTQDDSRSPRQSNARMDAMYSTSEFREACPSGATGDFPYGGDCRKYLSCWKGRGVLRLCSPGTLFNPRTLECDFPDKVSCRTQSKRSGRSYGSNWHANPNSFVSASGGSPHNQLQDGTQNYNGHGHYHHHHHNHSPDQQGQLHNHSPGFHHRHPPGFHSHQPGHWHHHHNHQHDYHTHGYNGLPTFTPYDRRYKGATLSRTNHSGVQPPVSGGWIPVSPQNPRPRSENQGPTPVNCSRVIPVYEEYPLAGNGSDCLPVDPSNEGAQDTLKNNYSPGYPSTGRGSGNSFPPRIPSRDLSPPVGGPGINPSSRPGSRSPPAQYPDEDAQIPNQEFQTEDLPYCDEISEPQKKPPADLTGSGSSRSGRFVQPPPALCPQGFSGLAPHPDCTKFLSCANGRTFVMDCGPGTRFNPNRLICDYPEKVKCAYADPYDLYSAGSSIVETHQPIKSDRSSHQTYDFDIDVRMSGNTVKCKPRENHDKPVYFPTQNRPNYIGSVPSRPSTGQNNPNYDSRRSDSDSPRQSRPAFVDPPPRNRNPDYPQPNRPNYSDPPARPTPSDTYRPPPDTYRPPPDTYRPPPRQFGPNYIEPSQQKGSHDKDQSKDDRTRFYDDPPPRQPTTTPLYPVYDDSQYSILTRFGDQDPQESNLFVQTTTEKAKESIQNEFEVLTSRPVIVTGRSVRTKTTTTPTTTVPPTKQHVFRPDPITPTTPTNKTKAPLPDWQVLRLRGGQSQLEGFVEIQITFGAWGILCDQRNQWSLEEANIVCKNLGYSRGADQSWQGKPAEGRMSRSSVIAANNVRCVGHEESILECYISGGGNCDIDRDAVWIRCHPNSVSSCQPGETSFDGKCYSLVVPKPDGDASVGFSQGEALSHCRSKGARLVDFTSQQENDYLSEWLVNLNSADSVMTSGVGVSVMGHPLWIWEGSEDSFSYKNWWPGWGGGAKGPSPKLDSGRALCVVARRYFQCAPYQVASGGRSSSSEPLLCDAEYFFWDVEDCGAMTNSHPYICERPADKVGCVVANGESYTGPANVTSKGTACVSWDSQQVLDLLQYKISQDNYKKSLAGHNKCRNVGGEEALPWCFADTPNGLRKQLCDIPKCGKGVQQKSANLLEYTCKENEFTCQFNNECIPSAWVCDGQKDCGNGADEKDCDKILDKFTKLGGKRLIGHDSEKWLQTSASACAQRCFEATNFQCRSFSHSEKMMECLLSDSNIGLSGSLSGSDTQWDYYEHNAHTIHCTQHFLCDNGKCISPELVCNGHDDCGDKADERNCSWSDYDIQIRLTGDVQPERGTVEVKFKDEWGLVCDDEFDFDDARVICRQLGYSDVSDILKHSVGLSNTNNLTKYLLDNLKCLGNESNIAQCEHNGWGVNDCAPTETVGLVCSNGNVGGTSVEDNGGGVASNMWRCKTSDELIHIDFLCDNVPDCTDKSDEELSRCKSPIEVRLVGVSRSSRPQGRLEVKRFGVWGTVCDDDFGSAEAQVVCTALGHKGPAKAYKNAKFGAGNGVIWLDSVHCTGNETGVDRCLHEGWGKTNCKHDEDVSIVCSVDIGMDSHGDPSIDEDGDTELLPEECGKISPELEKATSVRGFSARVVSGFETMKGSYPWQASVRLKSAGGRSAHWCGAVVVGKRYALTAGHCLRDYVKSHYFIRAGDYDTQTDEGSEQDLEIEEMWIHEKLDQGARLNNDLAVVRVKPPGFNFNTWVQPACLPNGPLPRVINCTISGWGTTGAPGSGFARTLHAAWLSPLSKADCSSEQVYGSDSLSAGMFCAGSLKGGSDSCQGDSGGPFVCPIRGRYTVHGITSWGHGCGRASSPGVYTDLWYYNKWITDTLTKSIL